MWPAGSRPGPGLPEREGTAPCLPEGARGPGGRPGPGHAGVRGRAGPRSWTPAPSPGVCAAQGGRARVVRRGREPPAGGGGTSAARPGGGERLSPGLGGSRCCLGRAVGRGHAAQARDTGAGRGVGGEAPPAHGPRPDPGPPCGGQVLPRWPLAPLGLVPCSGSHPGGGQSGQPGALAPSLVGGPARTPAQSPSLCTCRTGAHTPGPSPRSRGEGGGCGEL